MKKGFKLLAVFLSLILVLTSFAACGDKKTDDKDEDTKKEDVVETPKGDATHDGKLIAKWNGTREAHLSEGADPVKVEIVMDFNEDGTYTMEITEEGVEKLIIQVFMAFFGMDSEEDFEEYVTSQGMTMDEFLAGAKEELGMDVDEFSETGTWTTDGEGNLTLVANEEEGESEKETFKYTVAEDGKSAELVYEDDEVGTQTIELKK